VGAACGCANPQNVIGTARKTPDFSRQTMACGSDWAQPDRSRSDALRAQREWMKFSIDRLVSALFPHENESPGMTSGTATATGGRRIAAAPKACTPVPEPQ
jgi:hypothetical protein